MNTYIALLRGINVGGHKKILMTDLRELLSKSGLTNVTTYIQSGNAVFQSKENSASTLGQIIKSSIATHYGFEVPVLIKTEKEIQSILDDCPFSEEKKEKCYFLMLKSRPEAHLITEASKQVYLNEEFVITSTCIYFYCEAGYGRAKFNSKFFEKKLNTTATARNYKTMVKLLSLCAELN